MSKQFYESYWEDTEELSDLPYKWPVLRTLFPEGTHTFLDFGCGKGAITKRVAALRPNYTIYGTDISSRALSYAKKTLPNATYSLLSDTQKIPHKDNSFSVVLASDVLEHIYDTKTAFNELSRVLAPGGTLIITVPYNGKLKMLIAILVGFEFYFDPMSPHIRHFSPKTLSKSITDCGLSVERIGYYGRFYPLSRGMFLVARKRARRSTNKQQRSARRRPSRQ